jgi:hypothetical protein
MLDTDYSAMTGPAHWRFLLACAAHRHFKTIRSHAINTMNRAYFYKVHTTHCLHNSSHAINTMNRAYFYKVHTTHCFTQQFACHQHDE